MCKILGWHGGGFSQLALTISLTNGLIHAGRKFYGVLLQSFVVPRNHLHIEKNLYLKCVFAFLIIQVVSMGIGSVDSNPQPIHS